MVEENYTEYLKICENSLNYKRNLDEEVIAYLDSKQPSNLSMSSISGRKYRSSNNHNDVSTITVDEFNFTRFISFPLEKSIEFQEFYDRVQTKIVGLDEKIDFTGIRYSDLDNECFSPPKTRYANVFVDLSEIDNKHEISIYSDSKLRTNGGEIIKSIKKVNEDSFSQVFTAFDKLGSITNIIYQVLNEQDHL